MSKVHMYSASKSKHSQHAWWNEEVNEAINRRREAGTVHRKYSRLARAFPEAIPKEKVEESWRVYLDRKRIAQDIVKKKRQKRGMKCWKSLERLEDMGAAISGVR